MSVLGGWRRRKLTMLGDAEDEDKLVATWWLSFLIFGWIENCGAGLAQRANETRSPSLAEP